VILYKSVSNIGSRDANEDAVLCIEERDRYCFAVADGLGGHGKGDIASQKAVDIFKREFYSIHETNTAFLRTAFLNAQNELITLQQAGGLKHEMKTTAVCVSVINDKCQWAHIGDSRLYLFKKNRIEMRTSDHSVPQMLVLSGEIKEKHISRHPDRNRLLRVLGANWEPPRYDLSDEILLYDYQAFLLCSDGFWEHINPRKMCKFLKKCETADEWLSLMTTEVSKNGTGMNMDNYSAIAAIIVSNR
jgi:serine/threonine protein phosphatase PrpC